MNAAESALEVEAEALGYEHRVRVLTEMEPHVRGHAYRYLRVSPRGVGLEDLVAVGMAAAWEALVRRPGEAEATPYLKCRVRGAIVDFLRAQYRSCRESLACSDDDPSFDETCGDASSALTPEVLLDEARYTEQLRARVAALPARERFIVQARYFEDAALNGVAATMGVSEARVSQMHHRALGRLRGWLTERGDTSSRDSILA